MRRSGESVMGCDVVIIGAGGHGRVIADTVIACGDSVRGFLDDDVSKLGENIYRGACVIGRSRDAASFADCRFIVAIGDAVQRSAVAGELEAAGLGFYTAVHPLASVSPSAKIGEGSAIMPFAAVNAGASVGRHCIVNTGAAVEHDCVLGDFSHVSTRAALGGTVHIGEFTHVGIGACVRNNITVCASCLIGAGAVVVSDITKPGVWAGVPAKFLEPGPRRAL